MPKLCNYNLKAMEAALQEMQCDGNTLRAVAKKYGVSRSSLQFKIKNPGHKKT
jgi:transposase